MDTGRRAHLETILRGVAVESILSSPVELGGHEWLALLDCLPPQHRRELQGKLSKEQMGEIREALLMAISIENAGEPMSPQHIGLQRFHSPAPALEIARWTHWRELVCKDGAEECAQFVYFTTPKGRLLSRASLPDLALAAQKGSHRPRMETCVPAFPVSASALTAWRALRLGAWAELPVVDEAQRIVGVLYRERLAHALFLGPLLRNRRAPASPFKNLKAWFGRVWR